MNHFENNRDSDSRGVFLETLKNRFLAAIYRKDPEQTRHVYLQISGHARQCLPCPGETREKILRQVQAVFLRFYDFVTSPPVNLFVPYQDLKTLLADRVKTRHNHVCHIDFDLWQARTGLAPWQLDRVFENAITVQLTSGCSHFCRRCNEWALPGIRAHFSYAAARTLLKKLIAAGNTDPALYGASDPLDWEDGPHSLADLLIPFARQVQFSLITKVPRGKKRVLLRLVKTNIPISVSVTNRNRDRIAALESSAGIHLQKQHDSDDLLIPAGLDEDFTHIKSSITDAYGTEITPEGVFIIIPTFTSALYPMGHKKLPVTRKTSVFPKKKIGRQALLVDYFKPLEVVGEHNTLFHLPALLDVQVETLLLDNGSMELSPPGMRNLKEFFTIFEEPARCRRKQMTRSILRGLKKQFVPAGGYQRLSDERKRQYRQKIAAHLDFCDKTVVGQSRRYAVSFFFQAITAYLPGHDTRKQIIARLIQKEAGRLESRYGEISGETLLDRLQSGPDNTFFDIFRFFVTSLVFDRHQSAVARFIQTFPAVYDPVPDRFVKASHSPMINGCI
jgi:hypothetical protein